LESFRPLAFLGSQALIAISPLIDVFAPRLPLTRLAALLEEPAHLERFLAELAGDSAPVVSAADHEARVQRKGAL
jgi:hypothetical protein